MAASTPLPRRKDPRGHPARRAASILLVDDNQINRDALSDLLQLRGYSVTLAASGEEALAHIAGACFDLVLLDIEMPGLSGLEVLTTIRTDRSETDLPVIMVTARSSGSDIVEAFRLGANDYVTKPIDIAVALARIRTHLAHRWAVEDLCESEERYALAVHGANDGVWDWNLATNQVYWSARWKAILGFENGEIDSRPEEWLHRIHPEDVRRVTDALAAHLASGDGHFEIEHRLLHRNESFRWVRCRGAAVRNADGKATRFAGSLTDVTDSKLADALTGLPNRTLFLDVVERAIKRTGRRRGYMFALLALGLDRFTNIHDSLGPLGSDRLLVAVSQRLQGTLRGSDAIARDGSSCTLARLGGDEFNVLLDDITDVRHAVSVAERLRRSLEKPFEIDGQQVFTSAKVGMVVSTGGDIQPDAVLRDAATALHRAKKDGTNDFEIFDPAMRDRAISRLRVETELRQAIDQQAFEVYYQPIVSLKTGRIAGFEALLRWRHPVRGLIHPNEFIPAAEDTGLILELGRFALAESCRQMAAWHDEFGAAAPALLCANVSTRQLADGDLLGDVMAVLERTGLAATKLKLEITETAFISDVVRADSIMTKAKAFGIGWSLDDFGTGYSSLSYLRQLRVNTVKIDRSFVVPLGNGHGNGNGVAEMVRAIVTLAHNLGMDVVAEGVETAEQSRELKKMGCEFAQGYFYSKPVDTQTATTMITGSKRSKSPRPSFHPVRQPARPAAAGF